MVRVNWLARRTTRWSWSGRERVRSRVRTTRQASQGRCVNAASVLQVVLCRGSEIERRVPRYYRSSIGFVITKSTATTLTARFGSTYWKRLCISPSHIVANAFVR